MKIKFKVFSKSHSDEDILLVGYEQLNENGDWEYKRELRDEYILGTISDNQGNVKFIREPYVGKDDINGRELYCGDITKTETGVVELISYNNHSGGFDIGQSQEINETLVPEIAEMIFYIGNIHQNRELFYKDYQDELSFISKETVAEKLKVMENFQN